MRGLKRGRVAAHRIVQGLRHSTVHCRGSCTPSCLNARGSARTTGELMRYRRMASAECLLMTS